MRKVDGKKIVENREKKGKKERKKMIFRFDQISVLCSSIMGRREMLKIECKNIRQIHHQNRMKKKEEEKKRNTQKKLRTNDKESNLHGNDKLRNEFFDL